jgi:hypothetical protein
MDDRVNPPSARCLLVRSSEVSRLQGQLLARAYRQVCPEVRRALQGVPDTASSVDHNGRSSAAARMAAGA